VTEAPQRTLVIAPGEVLPEYLRGQPSDAPGASGIERSRGSVLIVLFVVTGAFGLPMLWRSDRFSSSSKWLWSVTVTLYTAALFYLMVMLVWWSVGDALN